MLQSVIKGDAIDGLLGHVPDGPEGRVGRPNSRMS